MKHSVHDIVVRSVNALLDNNADKYFHFEKELLVDTGEVLN